MVDETLLTAISVVLSSKSSLVLLLMIELAIVKTTQKESIKNVNNNNVFLCSDILAFRFFFTSWYFMFIPLLSESNELGLLYFSIIISYHTCLSLSINHVIFPVKVGWIPDSARENYFAQNPKLICNIIIWPLSPWQLRQWNCLVSSC